MHYVILAKDKPGMVETRLANYDAHKAYLSSGPIKFLMSGPLVDESDRTTMLGSFFLVEADSVEEARTFNANDPFKAADIWDTVIIEPFHMRVNNMGGPK